MAWFGRKKKKARKKPPVLEPVGAPVAQAVPVAQPGVVQPLGVMPAVQQPMVEVAPVGVIADTDIVVSTDASPAPQPTGWSKRSQRPIEDIHKKLDHMMDSKGKSLEERYEDRFGDSLPDSVTADPARKEYNEKKKAASDKPKIVFKERSQLKLTPKARSEPAVEKKPQKKPEVKADSVDKGPGIGSRIGSGIKSGGTKTKAAFGRAGSAVGRGAGAVKSGIGRGTSRVIGIFRRGDKEE
ncbi:MAG TPA: hypothetical protein EYM56_01175, partial [Candidatus Poseidoniales archaeon]|nr:hypothetical protein [Candidatus Poseidoniales archaeon]